MTGIDRDDLSPGFALKRIRAANYRVRESFNTFAGKR
jgi:hypothetical protein